MYMHSGTTDFLKLVSVLGFVCLAVWWLDGAIGPIYTIFLLIGVILLVIGTSLSYANQKITLDAITKFNAQDAQIDRYRMESFKQLARGQAELQKATAQISVLDAKRVDRLAQQRANLLTDAQRAKWEAQQQPQQPADVWSWDDDNGGDTFQGWG